MVSCGNVQVGDRGRSKETLRDLTSYMLVQLPSARRCTFEHGTYCCPSWDPTINEKEKKKAKRRLPLHGKDLLTVGANVGGEKFSQGRSLAAESEFTSQQTTKQPPGPPAAGSAWKSCFDRPAWSPCIGHDRSAVIREVRWVRCPGSYRTRVSLVRTEPDGPQMRLGESSS